MRVFFLVATSPTVHNVLHFFPKHRNLSSNNFTGPHPSFFHNLVNLEHLWVWSFVKLSAPWTLPCSLAPIPSGFPLFPPFYPPCFTPCPCSASCANPPTFPPGVPPPFSTDFPLAPFFPLLLSSYFPGPFLNFLSFSPFDLLSPLKRPQILLISPRDLSNNEFLSPAQSKPSPGKFNSASGKAEME